MLHKYYYCGKSRNYNETFESITDDEIVTWPYAAEHIRQMIEAFREKLEIYGYVRCLYLEKPANSNRYWKVVVAVWSSADEYSIGVDPNEVLRINTDNLDEPVRGKYTDEYTQSLPLSVYHKFVSESGRDFF